MESQGRLPLQSGGGGGPWAFGADDESGSLLQVTRDKHIVHLLNYMMLGAISVFTNHGFYSLFYVSDVNLLSALRRIGLRQQLLLLRQFQQPSPQRTLNLSSNQERRVKSAATVVVAAAAGCLSPLWCFLISCRPSYVSAPSSLSTSSTLVSSGSEDV
jgi:hypothetical protein